MSYVTNRFELQQSTVAELRKLTPPFGYNGFGEFIFYRTYSRLKPDGGQEDWADCIIRVINGVMSIRKNFYLSNHISWDEKNWQKFARRMALSAFKMNWLPPGRGLWTMGTEFVYERGAMALYNCAFTQIGDDIGADCYWIMDALMNGVGVGFQPVRNDEMDVYLPDAEGENQEVYDIPDSREGWCESVMRLIRSFLSPGQPHLDFLYDKIRPQGELIKSFGGTASGPEPLMKLHTMIREFFHNYALWKYGPQKKKPEYAIEEIAQEEDKNLIRSLENSAGEPHRPYDTVRLKTDLANAIGCCVVAGNVRRSAEIAVAPIDDDTFADLKNYKMYPERAGIGWMSNNSVTLRTPEDFGKLGEIAQRVITNGEPGYLNLVNVKFGRLRVGKDDSEWCSREDSAVGLNPCGEIPLENKEVCNIAETFPTVCETTEEWHEACEFACFYCSTVSLLPTHSQETNRVVARNRRIGVGIVDFTGWKQTNGVHNVIAWMREGYKVVRRANRKFNAEAGVPEAIRVTTVKPGGTVPKLPGRTSGIGYPTFHETIRRVRVAKTSRVSQILMDANVPYEEDEYSDNTWVFEFPILQGPAKAASDVTLWEQATNLALMQREWADNAVSNTLYFRPKWLLSKEWTHVPTVAEIFHFLVREAGLPARGNLEEKILKAIQNKEVYEDRDIRVIRDTFDTVRMYRFNPKHEEDDIENVLSFLAPVTKSVSLLPHTAEGVYAQMPESGCSREEYDERVQAISPIDWSSFSGSDGEDTKFCDGEVCEIPLTQSAPSDRQEAGAASGDD